MLEKKNFCLFTDINEVPTQYPWLSVNEKCDVAVIGGGCVAMACAYRLAQSGMDVVVASQKPIGYSSACVNSSMVQPHNEIMLTKLCRRLGKDTAVAYLKSEVSAIDELEQLDKQLGGFDFIRRDSFLFTNSKEQINRLHTEYLMRRHNGFPVMFLEKSEAGESFSFDLQAGILASDSAAEVDGYKLCHALAKGVTASGARIYENTAIASIDNDGELFALRSTHGSTIKARKIIMAIGKAMDEYLDDDTTRKTAFSLATSPIESFSGYSTRAISHSIDNGISLRSTKDNRLLITGLDCSLVDGGGRLGRLIGVERIIERKYKELDAALCNMLIGIDNISPEYEYYAEYTKTPDSMPIAKELTDFQGIYLAVPGTVNGILQALIISKSITAQILTSC